MAWHVSNTYIGRITDNNVKSSYRSFYRPVHYFCEMNSMQKKRQWFFSNIHSRFLIYHCVQSLTLVGQLLCELVDINFRFTRILLLRTCFLHKRYIFFSEFNLYTFCFPT